MFNSIINYSLTFLNLVPPKEVIVMDEYGQRLRDPVGPFNEGAHLTVICESEGGQFENRFYL